ncbi:hypothetical protein MVEN_00633500 [Mycena venus]|uniref:Uncharacterized protein n=1 Tax=Mycena venus TaxID=2733690 RepID=A0A8H6YPM4_9AGAR|nr:hypothetical protein MVEN_00633500 [Mycena venus]
MPAQIAGLKASGFDFAPLLAAAIAGESDDDEEHDSLNEVDEEYPPNPLNDIDIEYPPLPLPDPLNEVDDVSPSQPPRKKPRCSPSFDEVVATAVPAHRGPHHQRPAKPKSDAAKAKSKTGSKRRKAEKRDRRIATEGHIPHTSTVREYVHGAEPLATSLDAATLPAAHGAYVAKIEQKGEKWGSKKCRSLLELLGLGFRLVQWNGIDPCPLVDSKGRVFTVLAGQPDTPSYKASVAAAFQEIMNEGNAAKFPADMRKHRRSLFAAINVGLTYGKGQTVPTWLLCGNYAAMTEQLLANEHIDRMATFASSAFAMWAPRLHQYYRTQDAKLRKHFPQLPRIFPRSVFSCAAFNFGPNVWTFQHCDVWNVPFGLCAVQAAGDFDLTKGGHLVLWELKLVIEFPSGALILLPSATISHSNIPVQKGDTHVSFTQFTAGGLMPYVDNGCRTLEELRVQDPQEFERLEAERDSRWEMGLGLLSTMDELLGVK